MQASEPEPEARRRRTVVVLLVLGLGAGGLGLFLLSWGASTSSSPEFLQVSLQSLLQADYFADHNLARVAALDPALIEDVMRDQDPEAADLAGRLATLQALLESAVPTATPFQDAGPGAPLATSIPAQVGQTTALPGPPTPTPLPGGGPSPAITGTPTPGEIQTSAAESPTPPITLSRTLLPTLPGILTPTATRPGSSLPTATRTPVPTTTRTPEPTSTPRPAPTRTPVPTSTPTPSPTDTPEPPSSLVADLSISKRDQQDPIKRGTNLSYQVTVMNSGPSDATGVLVIDTLPLQVDFVKVSGGNCAESAGVVTCDIGKFSEGNKAEFMIEVHVHLDAIGVLLNTVSVSAQTLDDNPANNTATEKTTVSP